MITAGRRVEVRPWVYRLASENGVTGRVRNAVAAAILKGR